MESNRGFYNCISLGRVVKGLKFTLKKKKKRISVINVC